MKIVALIPARGGSKSIPYKNIKVIAGKPLIYWVCLAARKSRMISDIYVSTDDKKIKEVVKSFKLNVKTINRDPILATDKASTDSVLVDFMKKVDFDILVTIQATSPITTQDDLDTAIDLFINQKFDSLVTGVLSNRFFWSLDGKSLNYDFRNRPRRQDFKGVIQENGAFYITKKRILKKFSNRLGGKIGIYQMDKSNSIELDEPEDWDEVDNLLRKRIYKDLKSIKILITDFDGVWTDNKVLTDDLGRESVYCSKEDSLGLDYFHKSYKIPVMVVSREKNKSVVKRCQKLNLPIIYCSINKVSTIEEELKERGLKWSDVCFIGNDINDLDVMNKAKISFCPADARPEVQKRADFVLKKNGGNGAMREIFDLFIL